MADPLVTVGIPTYNRAASLRRSIRMIQDQSYRNLDILISDNASTDDTPAVCEALAAGDPRIRVVRHVSNIGLHGNHNFCMDQSRGEFLCLFHDHDEHGPDLVNRYVAFLHQHPEVGVVCSDWDLIDDEDRIVGARIAEVSEVTPGLDYIGQTIRSGRSSIGIPGAMIRRSALAASRFDPEGPTGFGDFVIWFEIAERYAIGHLRERGWRWRVQRDSMSARTIESLTHDYALYLRRYCDDHLRRWPAHAALVARWRADIDHYLFWALAFELGLECRRRLRLRPRADTPTLFDIYDYALSPEQVMRARRKLRESRRGALAFTAWVAIELSLLLRVSRPLAWSTYHHASLRKILGMR